MKLSFSIPSKSSSKPKPSHTFDDSSNKQDPTNPSKHFLTEFDPSKSSTNPEAKIVIPPIQNQWRPLKKMKNLELPITDPNSDAQTLRFEQETPSAAAAEPGSNVSYGLNLRQTTKKNTDNGNDNDGEGGEKKPDDVDVDVDDDRAWHRAPAAETVLLQKLKDDLKRLPEDQGFEEFKDVPVEGFGVALLAGYGWSEGMGIGKNAREDVKVVQYERRTAKEGLGFVSEDHASIRKKKKEEKDGKAKENGRDVGFVVGKSVRIVGGRDAGLKGSVLRRISDDWVVLKLSRSGEEVKVRVGDIVELDSIEEERYLRKSKESKDKGSKNRRGRGHGEVEEMRVDVNGDRRKEEQAKKQVSKRGRGHGEVEEIRVDVNGDRRKEEKVKKQVSWLTSHIRVRVISRDLKGGRLYLKKGEVLDVVGPTTCDISMDESKEIIQGVSQDLLETAIPRRGGPVLILYGKHKGAYGSLVERDSDRDIGIVKDADTHELLNVKLEQIAEYIGDPSLLGH